VKFEYGFGSDDMLVIGIADALGENLVLDWKQAVSWQKATASRLRYTLPCSGAWTSSASATLGVVYLGKAGVEGSQAESNVFQFTEAEAVVVEDFVQQFLKQYSLGNRRHGFQITAHFVPTADGARRP